MESLPDLEDVSGLGAVEDVLQNYWTELEQCATNFDQQPPSASNFALFPCSISNVPVQLAASSQPTSTE